VIHTDEVIERERYFLLPTYNRYPIALDRGKEGQENAESPSSPRKKR